MPKIEGLTDSENTVLIATYGARLACIAAAGLWFIYGLTCVIRGNMGAFWVCLAASALFYNHKPALPHDLAVKVQGRI